MKKIVCFIVTVTLILSSVSIAFAKNGGLCPQNKPKDKNHGWNDWNYYEKDHDWNEWNCNKKDKVQEKTFLINKLTLLSYGKYKIPKNVIEEGMAAAVTLDNTKGILTVTGDKNKVIIVDFSKKTITTNNVIVNEPNVFKLKQNKYMKALLEYLGKQLGYKITYTKNKITVKYLNEVKKDDVTPVTTKGTITVTPVGTSIVANTLNATTQYFIATAAITAGKATGGYALLYVGDYAVAIDNTIAATDTTVDFTTSDGTPTNTELQAMVPKGGTVTVKLYNSGNLLINTITSGKALTVDYIAPTITSAVSAVYSVINNTITISVTGAGAVNDKVDVKKISLYDTAQNKTYQLTDSTGVVSSSSAITIKLSAADKLALASYGTSGVYMYIAAGSLISDTAGNTSAAFSSLQLITVTVNNVSGTTQGIISVTPVGTSVVANTLNATTQCFIATATITPGKAAGGYAVLYVGDAIVAIDNAITATDTTVDFTTSDGTPTNVELQALVPKGGTVTVKLYNSGNLLVNTIISDKTLTVDYIAPTITSAGYAVYSVPSNTITISVNGASAVNDKVDVKRISLYDTALSKMYQLTDSTGVVSSSTAITIKLSAADKLVLAAYGSSVVYMYITAGSLISDTAGNTAAGFAVTQLLPVTVSK
jgi:hypothetical protein